MSKAAQQFDVRPGEACIVNRNGHRQAVTTRLYCDPRSRRIPLGVEPDLPHIVAAVFGGREAALEIAGEYGPSVELDATATRGAIPIVFPTTESRQLIHWLRGPRTSTFAERVEETWKRYELPSRSVAECVCRLVDASFDEGEAVRLAKETHARELARQGLYRFDWPAWTDDLIRAREQALARAGEGRV